MVKVGDLPEHYRRQAEAQLDIEPDKPPIREEDLSTVADNKAEKELQKLCEQYLLQKGIEFLHLSPRAREKRGWPDLTFVLKGYWEVGRGGMMCRASIVHGRPIAVELKAAGGKLSADQVSRLTRMSENKWEVYVIRAFETFSDLVNGRRVKQWRAECSS